MSRIAQRHSHISIGLRFLHQGTWEHIEALGWHEGGFNFYHGALIDEPLLDVKRRMTPFAATVMWSSVNTSDEVALGRLANEMIYQHANAPTTEPAMHDRLVKLIRIPGMVAQKQKVLATLGQDISDEKLADLLAQRRQQQPLYQYGVRVESDAWREVVKNALSISSVVMSLEKWSGALGTKP